MKKGIIITTVLLLLFTIPDKSIAEMKMGPTRLGIGTNDPHAQLEVNYLPAKVYLGIAFLPVAPYMHIVQNVGTEAGIIRVRNSDNTPGDILLCPEGGNVGIGTKNPFNLVDLGSTLGKKLAVYQGPDGNSFYGFGISSNTLEIYAGADVNDSPSMVVKKTTGSIGIGKADPSFPLEMGSGAHVTIGGVWTNASYREYKENIQDLSYVEAKSALSSLKPAKFNYKVDKDEDYLGFIAEDVPDLVATKDRKSLSPMDIVAVLTKVVQQQQETIEKQKIENAVLNTKLAEVVNRIEALEKW